MVVSGRNTRRTILGALNATTGELVKTMRDRCYPSLDELVARATAWLDGMSAEDRRNRRGRNTSEFDWLPT